jgi:thiosulfate dehydrogenase [quinone] large subunit
MKNLKTTPPLNGIRLYAFFALRLAIGWHFLYEGVSKLLIPNWTSADFLQLSSWIFAPFFRWIADTPPVLATVDWINIIGLIFVGLVFILGTLERVGAIVGMSLLLLYWLANPPFVKLDFGVISEGHYLVINKNIVELLAILILYLFPTGKYLGLEHLFRKNRITPQPEPETPSMADMAEKVPVLSPEKVLEPVKLDRRALIKGLTALPVMGAFSYALYQKAKWESYEEKNLVDAVTGASAKTLNIAGLKELKGTLPFGKIKNVPFSRLILGGNLFMFLSW